MKKKNQPPTGTRQPQTANGIPPTANRPLPTDKVVFDIAQDVRTGQYLPAARTTVRAELEQPNAAPTKKPYSTWETSGWNWAPWGGNDRFPSEIREKIECVPIAAQSMYRLATMMYGNGIGYYRRSDLLQQGAKVQRAFVPDVEDFLQASMIETRFLPAQFMDYRMYANCFSELIFSEDKSQIVRIWHKYSEHSRLSRQSEISYRSEYLLYSPKFVSDLPLDSEIAKIPLMQPDNEAKFLARLRGWKMAWHSYFPTPGMIYYARPPWIGLFRKNGWMDVASAVPEVVNAMMRNQITLKYQIIVHIDYFKARYPQWDEYTAEQRDAKIDDLQKIIDTTLVGTDNAYRSIVSIFGTDTFGRETGKIEIVAIDDKTKKDDWVPSSTAADAQIVQSLGYSPTMMGLASERGGVGAGSGSDKREMYNILISTNTLEQRIVLEPLQYIARYNARTNPDWDVVFFIDNTFHTTTNAQETGMVDSPDTIAPQ